MSTLWSSRLAILGRLAVTAFLAGAVPARAAGEHEPVVVEMFLSQACKESPAAAAFAGELRQRPDLVVLVWHIDYWNILSNRKHGRWRDPFSDASFSARQRIYNRKIRKRGTVFTPQAIVNGAGSEVGSKRAGVEDLIEAEKREPPLTRTAIARADGAIAVTIDPSGDDYRDVFLVTFHSWSSTDVSRGDNAGVNFAEPHVVTGMTKLGVVSHKAETFAFPPPSPAMGCAVLVQEADQGRVVGARYCP